MKGKILEIDGTGSWTSEQYGEMFTYLVRIQTPDEKIFTGEANAKSDTKEGLPYKIGDEVEFEHKENPNIEYPDKLKIKKEEGYSSNRANNKEDLNDVRRSVALSYAKDLVIGGKVTLEEMYKVADRNELWLKNS